MKNELKYVPFFGWSFYLTEQLFVNRDYTKDKSSLVKHFENITTFHYPCVVSMSVRIPVRILHNQTLIMRHETSMNSLTADIFVSRNLR